MIINIQNKGQNLKMMFIMQILRFKFRMEVERIVRTILILMINSSSLKGIRIPIYLKIKIQGMRTAANQNLKTTNFQQLKAILRKMVRLIKNTKISLNLKTKR